ncbi:MAG TPA: NAD/NADP transhydrogenase subunit alpha [Microbacterium sp.]|nr:NAD/NADP transhydrogenase subunit alpha [Microbacterium sp.]
MAHSKARFTPLTDATRAIWERALQTWGVHLTDPTLSPGEGTAMGTPAWFSFPPSVTVDPTYLVDHGVSHEMESIFAHEIGHHVLAPSTRIDSLKIRHQMARALGAVLAHEPRLQQVAYLANLWTDLLVNTRLAQLQRADAPAGTSLSEVGIVRLSRAMFPAPDSRNRLWWVYCRAYELLWQLPAGTLCALDEPPLPVFTQTTYSTQSDPIERVQERFRDKEKALRAAQAESARIGAELAGASVTNPAADAVLVAETVRLFLTDPVAGAARFGVIAAPYLRDSEEDDTSGANNPRGGENSEGTSDGCAAGAEPPTAQELGRILADQRMKEDLPQHPGSRHSDAEDESGTDADQGDDGGGQGFDVAQTLRIYDGLSENEVLAAWYRSEAARWVRPYTRRAPARLSGGIPGPVELWENGDALADLDWPLTMRSGVVIPGVTTKRRSELDDEPVVQETSLELDLYIDSSGSMPSPGRGSPAVLAGTILALSVLRGGGRLRVTSFSGPGQVAGMARFGRDSNEIIAALSAFFGGGTSFPLDLYGERYRRMPAPTDAVQRHVVVLSDDGLVSMFGTGNQPFVSVAREVRSKLSTGTLMLMDPQRRTAKDAAAAGYDVIYLDTMADAPRACITLAEMLHG